MNRDFQPAKINLSQATVRIWEELSTSDLCNEENEVQGAVIPSS